MLTFPNAVSLLRLVGAFVFCYLLLGTRHHLAAAVLLGIAGASDWVDGYLARRLKQISSVGKVLDPVADRVLLMVAVASAVAWGAVALWLAVVVLTRELAVSAGLLRLLSRRVPKPDVVFVGKIGTFALMVAFPLFLASHSQPSWSAWATPLGWAAATLGIAASWAAGITYLFKARQALLEASEHRSPQTRQGGGGHTTLRLAQAALEAQGSQKQSN